MADLDGVRIAKPCPADWDAMAGDERVRFCGTCRQNVYDVSALTREEAEALLAKTKGRPCLRLFRRRDGTVMTRDCPVGVDAWRRRATRVAAVAAAAAGLAAGLTQGLRARRLPVAAPAVESAWTEPLPADRAGVASEVQSVLFIWIDDACQVPGTLTLGVGK